ncbi:MAG: pilus assembly protein PilM [Syntrophaceae bacterium]|nr:pilus assembly protein PilM [Syntrophaceae bacterium]
MMIGNTSFGIDFRPNHLILTLLKKSFGKIQLVDYGIYPLSSEAQKEEREAQWGGLIRSFVSKHDINKEHVWISIPREKVVTRFITLPIATQENLRKVMEYEIPKYTPYEKEEVYFDYQVLKKEKEQLRLFAAFVKKAEVDYYLSLLKGIGIQPTSIQIPSTAAMNLFFYHMGPREEGVSVLFEVNEPFFEMNLIQAREWKESFFLPFSQEERQSRMIRALSRSGIKGETLSKAGVFIYGMGADEQLLATFREANPVQDIYPPPMGRIRTAGETSRIYPIYASVGVPLGGLVRTRLALNLLPLEMRKKIRQIGKPLFIVLVSLSVILGLMWGVSVFAKYRKELKTIKTEMKIRKPEVDAVEKLQKQEQGLKKEIVEFEKIRSGEVSKGELLRELTQLLPSTVWIWNLKYNGKEIELSGYADSASDLISLLDKSPLFEKVEFLAPVTKERQTKPEGEKEKERFRIKARLEGRRTES